MRDVTPMSCDPRAVTRRRLVYAAILLVAVVGGLVAYDALVETDEERLERLGDAVSGTLSLERMRGARANWVDLDRQPLEVSALGESWLFREGEREALDDRARVSLRPVLGDRLRVLSSGVEIEGESATVSMRVLADRGGLYQLAFDLEKVEGDWLIARLAVRR